MSAPYPRLLELVRGQREIVISGDWAGMAALDEELAKVAAELPDVPPAAMAPLLAEAARLNAETVRIIERNLEGVRAELLELGRGRRMIAGYAGPDLPTAVLDWQG